MTTLLIDDRAPDVDVKINQGSDFGRVLFFTNTETGLAIDLTGYSFKGQARKKILLNTAPDIELVFTILDQTDPATKGKVMWSIPNIATSSLEILKTTSYLFDVELIQPGGKVKRMFQGILMVYVESTK